MNLFGAHLRTRKRLPWRSLAFLCAVVAVVSLAFAAAADADAPTTTPRELAGWQRSAFTIRLDCVAGTSTGDELYATRYWMDWESAYDEKLWSDGVIGGTLWVMYYFVTQRDGIHQFYYYSVGHNDGITPDENEATKSLEVKIDTTSPSSTVSGIPSGWSQADVVAGFAASDALSGMSGGEAKTEFSVDSGATWTTGTSATLRSEGTTTLLYRSTDTAGNVESSKSASVRIDKTAPTTGAYAASVKRGKRVRLFYQASDALPGCGQASVRLKILKGSKVKKTITAGICACNVRSSYSWRCALAKGRYSIAVYATDVAGNAQSTVGRARLTVR
jgi:hypothetical protein